MSTCKECGMDLTGRGLFANIEHLQSHNQVAVYKPYTDNEIREAFMELGMPSIGFTAMNLAEPTEMERKIFEDNSRFK